ncbi:hypothetical protein EW146_g9261 [Bondarzewia mesenterica]|uniref:Uncharacterized protein n=1 Tax=Bondarzewia mesenterica TaxID=1095465 RepID=A0A4S4L7Z1_9AGAM|nr:hypothetical protein EW146_g9261 [Bondarzewia mesenterica]
MLPLLDFSRLDSVHPSSSGSHEHPPRSNQVHEHSFMSATSRSFIHSEAKRKLDERRTIRWKENEREHMDASATCEQSRSNPVATQRSAIAPSSRPATPIQSISAHARYIPGAALAIAAVTRVPHHMHRKLLLKRYPVLTHLQVRTLPSPPAV